jgi:sodium/potassium-transporting ATPase subunit alpha
MTSSDGMGIARQPAATALASLNSCADGLRDAEAARRLVEFGANCAEDAGREPAWIALAREFSHFFALILRLAAILALFAGHFDPGVRVCFRRSSTRLSATGCSALLCRWQIRCGCMRRPT